MALRGLILGWYHQRNAGDDRLAQSFERWLNDHQLLFLPHTQTPPLEALRSCDYVILGGGSIANAHHGAFRQMRSWVNAAGVPVFGAGITVSKHEAFQDEMRVFAESGGRLWVRDQASARNLGYSREECVVAPDLSWLFPLRPETFCAKKEPGLVGVNLRPWPRRTWSAEAWREALRVVENERGRLAPWPLCFGKEDDRPLTGQACENAPMPEEFDPTLPGRAELVVAMRFHAIIFSIQAGTPFVAIGNSQKLRHLLEGLGLQDAIVPVEEPELFSEKRVLARRELTTARLQAITREQSEMAWRTADAFKKQIEAEAEKARARRARLGSRAQGRLRRAVSKLAV